MKIEFSYEGQKFNATVPDDFKDLPYETQQGRLFSALQKKHGRTDTPWKENKNVLDYLALIERPAQALKVGVKESWLGSKLHQALGGVDLTPNEGFFTGAGRGWMGNDEIRTQDYLPEDMNPFLKGVLGFAGDVATDPITYIGAGTVRFAGEGISKAGKATGATAALNKASDALMSVKVGESEVGLADLGRWFNIQSGKGKIAKGESDIVKALYREHEEYIRNNLPALKAFFVSRGKATGQTEEAIETAFVEAMERPKVLALDDNKNPIFKTDRDGNKVPLIDRDTKDVHRNADGTIKYRMVYEGFKPIDAKLKAILGDDGVEKVDQWSKYGEALAKESDAAGMPIQTIDSRGYFPRVINRKAEKRLKALGLEGLDPEEQHKALFGAGYRQQRSDRLPESSLEANKLLTKRLNERWVEAGHGKDNPLDTYWDLNPTLALSTRALTQAKALQKKFFIDSITDSGYGIGPQISRELLSKLRQEHRQVLMDDLGVEGYKRLTNEEISESLVDFVYERVKNNEIPVKGEFGVGVWLRSAAEGKEKRVLNDDWKGRLDTKNEQFKWELASPEETKGMRKVKGMPEGYVPQDKLDAAWVTGFRSALDETGFMDSNVTPEIVDIIKGIEGKRTPAIINKALQEYQLQPSTIATYELAAMKADKVVDAMSESSASSFYAPKQVARQIEDVMEVMSGTPVGSKEIQKFLDIFDQTQNAWKAWTLGVRPAYHARNVIGNFWNAYLITGMGENVPKAVKLLYNSARLQYFARFNGDPRQKEALLEGMKGARLSFEDASAMPKLSLAEWRRGNYADTGYSMERIVTEGLRRGVTAGHYTDDSIRELTRIIAVREGKGKTWESTIGAENPAVRTGFLIGGSLEGNARFAVFMHTLQQIKKNPGKYKWTAPDGTEHDLAAIIATGKAPKEYFKTKMIPYRDRTVKEYHRFTDEDVIFDVAAREVQGSLFDYSDVSAFEKNVLKRTMPFYTWTRKNIPVQLKHLIKNPQRAEKLAIAKQQFEHETGEVDHTDLGKFWSDRVPVFMGSEEKGVVEAFTLLNLLPMADLQRLYKPKELIQEMISPFPKQLFEQLANYDTFMNRDIVSRPGQVDDFMGIKLSPRLHHLVKLLVPLTEVNRLNPAGVFGERILDPKTGLPSKQTDAFFGLGAERSTYKDIQESSRWLRFFSGVATYNINLDRERYFMNKNLKKDLAELKGKLKWALKKGQHRKAEELLDLIEAVEHGETVDPFERRT